MAGYLFGEAGLKTTHDEFHIEHMHETLWTNHSFTYNAKRNSSSYRKRYIQTTVSAATRSANAASSANA